MNDTLNGTASDDSWRLCVLLADDEADILEILATHLERKGYDVMIVQNGTDALKMIRDLLPAVVVLDEGMPGLRGSEICQNLALDPATACIPAILLTGYRGVVAVGGNIRRIITKPFSSHEVVRAVMELSPMATV